MSSPPSSPSSFVFTPSHDEEVSATKALWRIARALPVVERTYAIIRFMILRVKLLATMDLLLPSDGPILDVGCGFGLWSAYFSQMQPGRRIIGIDPNAHRISMAKKVAERLGVKTEFYAEDVRQTAARGPFRAVYLLDVLHHIPSADQVDVVRQLTDMLEEGGTLVIKDITTKPWFGLKFTEILDRAMVGMKEELTYRHRNEWSDLLRDLGYQVRVVRVPDVLPYPHVIIAATKGSKPATTSAVLN
ncbi:MAG TPA: class I SAM-dependent methyltransferase [Pseudomonadota bacterium]|nr:class I SAM-dependent methyltransferase [Pseudomonadota bacterium]